MIVNIIRAVAWPLTFLFALFMLWRAGVLRDLGRRITKVSVFQVSLELATLTSNDLPGFDRLRDPVAPPEMVSGETSLMQQLLRPEPIDYLVIDLRDGRRWLTSRVFLFAEVFSRQRNVRCIVFVERRDGVSRRLVGLAHPAEVKWALATRFPWLEVALTTSYHWAFGEAGGFWTPPVGDIMLGTVRYYRPPDVTFAVPGGRLTPAVAERAVSLFFRHPNIHWTAGPDGLKLIDSTTKTSVPIPEPWSDEPANPLAPPSRKHEWVTFDGEPQRHEHAEWLTGQRLTDIMGPAALRQDAWVFDDPLAPEGQRVVEVLARTGDFVAMVNEERSFRRLVERTQLVEQITKREVQFRSGA